MIRRSLKEPLFWLSPRAAAFIYTVLLRPRPLRRLAHAMICRLIPEELTINGVRLALNQRDAIVSENLFLGCYERFIVEFVTTHVRPGQHFLDIGANIGLYSLLAGSATGPSGRVVGVEPDPVNLGFVTLDHATTSSIRLLRSPRRRRTAAANAADRPLPAPPWTSSGPRNTARIPGPVLRPCPFSRSPQIP